MNFRVIYINKDKESDNYGENNPGLFRWCNKPTHDTTYNQPEYLSGPLKIKKAYKDRNSIKRQGNINQACSA